MSLPSILEKVNPYIDTNLSVNDMWKLATVGYDSQIIASEQIPPMSLLIEQNIGGSDVLGVRSEEELKTYVQEVLNKTTEVPEDSSTNTTNTDTGNGSEKTITDTPSSSEP